MKYIYIYLVIGLVSLLWSCEDYVDIGQPPNDLTQTSVFTEERTAQAALDGIYHQLQESGFASGDRNSVSLLSAVSSDEMIEYAQENDRQAFFSMTLQAENSHNESLWASFYERIYSINAFLEGVTTSEALPPEFVKRAQGEALALRAFSYLYLTELYGAVPLAQGTAYQENAQLERSPQVDVYNFILSDLLQAREHLEDHGISNPGIRTRIGAAAVESLLARVYLYQQAWPEAEKAADAVLAEGSYTLENDLNAAFLADSAEAIWQLLPTDPRFNTWQGQYYILTGSPETPLAPASLAMREELVNAFDAQDLRKQAWIGSLNEGGNTYAYPFKYKQKQQGEPMEYNMMLRLAEIYLIRAEARLEQGKISEARSDLNMIRTRAGLADFTGQGEAALRAELYHQRRLELFAEGGHRWIDLKRWNRAGTVLAPLKPAWDPHDKLYPIPASELLKNPNLDQNEGY
ncbi:RagB/SusD family nutrient uptake outer membrane protein [Mesonia aquimarina]|uniref:RagB/SusD family nutrient uptake outer membrane protein n=1 Tax=Mesonia aquimarina TaxID=1504967 RepID=UPI000EF58361|nr:RagB/SusD family nutrient uptake outer membrane protein [Mesonia aquimarina]